MAGDVEARPAAGLDVQVLGDTAGDVGSPTNVAAGMSQGLGQVQDVHAVGGRQLDERDHAEASATFGQGWPKRASMASAWRPRSVRAKRGSSGSGAGCGSGRRSSKRVRNWSTWSTSTTASPSHGRSHAYSPLGSGSRTRLVGPVGPAI